MNKHAIKSGVILGVISVVITLLVYLINVNLFAAWWYFIIPLVISLTLVSYFGIKFRDENGGYMTFGKAWVYSFITFLVAGVISLLFQILLYTVIDPEIPGILIKAQMENQEAILSNFGMPEDQMEEALEGARESIENSMTVGGMIQGFLILLIIYAIGALITGAIIKKKEPEFE